jgi:flagellar motor protein MotB
MNRAGGNIKLSLDRALSVNNALMQAGTLAGFRNKLDQPIISYSAYADSRPLIKEDPADGRNRRVDLRIVLSYKPPVVNSLLGVATEAVRK